MTFNLRTVLTSLGRHHLAQRNSYYARKRAEMEGLTDDNLVATAKYTMSQLREVEHWKADDPSHDAIFYYIIIPELLKRLERSEESGSNEKSG